MERVVYLTSSALADWLVVVCHSNLGDTLISSQFTYFTLSNTGRDYNFTLLKFNHLVLIEIHSSFFCRLIFTFSKAGLLYTSITITFCCFQNFIPKLQALVYDILPSTTAVFSYAIGSRKLSANEQCFIGAQTVVSLLQTTQIKQGVSFIAINKVYTSTNKTTVV